MSQQVSGRRRRREDEFSPGELFANGEQGAWYDPSDFSTLYQDSAGTTPVTDLGQPVGLMLDKANWDGRGVVNLLQYTEQFDQWTPEGVTISVDDTVAPDGTSTADKIVEDASSGQHGVAISFSMVAGVTYEYSIYAKAAERSDFRIIRLAGDVPVSQAGFDLTAGTAANGGKIVDVGGGWYRCSFSFTATTTLTGVRYRWILIPTGSSTYTGTPGSGLYFWGAQLEAGSTATAYQPNGAGVGGPGNHAAQATTAAMPYVQARVNLAEGTDSLTGWADQINGVTRSYPAVTTPNGIPAVLAQLDTSPGWAMETVTAEVSGSHVYSIYVKAGTAANTLILLRNDTTSSNLASLTFAFGSPSGNYESVGDGWYRIWITGSSISAGDSMTLYWYPGNNVIGASAYGAGGQLEVGSSPTTYQRVTTATDYADIGLPRYLEFDGVDDYMELSGSSLGMFNDVPSISMIIGSRVLTSKPQTFLFATTPTGSTRAILREDSNKIDAGGRRLDGDSFASVSDSTAANVLDDHVVSALFRMSQAKLALRVDASETVLDPYQTSGNTSSTDSQDIYIGRVSTTYANMRFYQIVMRAADTAGTLLDQTERFVARKTGIAELAPYRQGSFSWDSSTSSPGAA